MKNKKTIIPIYIVILLVLLCIIIPIILFFIINVCGGNEYATKSDLLTYYATMVGASITGYIAVVGLYYTLKQNSIEIEEQRKFDQKNMDEQKKQFEKELKIKLINDKLDKYKEIYLTNEEIINKIALLSNTLCKYFQYSSCPDKRIKYREETTDLVESIVESHNKTIFLRIFLNNNDVISKSEKNSKNLNGIIEKVNEIFKGEISPSQFDIYINDLIMGYKKFANLISDESEKIYKKIEEL